MHLDRLTLVFNFGLKPKSHELSLKRDVNKMANCLYFWRSCHRSRGTI